MADSPIHLALGTPFLALTWARPGALWACTAPLVFLVLVRLLESAPRRVTGTFELWKELAPKRARGSRARGSLPPWAWATAFGLLSAALAWAGPRGARAKAPRVWTCVVDRSPSMGLVARVDGAETRLEASLRAAEEWLAEHARRGEPVRWLARGRAPLELARGERPGRAWLDLADSESDGEEPDWALHDQPGKLWITDRVPPSARQHAGLFASGGPAVPGPISADGRTTVEWDGGPEGGALRRIEQARTLAVRVREPEGRRLPEVIERVLRAWCAGRGFELVRTPQAGTLLVVELVGELVGDAARDARQAADPDLEEFECARDGWRAHGRAAVARPPREAAEQESLELEDWLIGRTPSGLRPSLVRARPGRIELELVEFFEPEGDPVLFALSWARLLDRSARRIPGVLSLGERLAAGEPSLAPGRPPPASESAGADLGPTLDAGLALTAALCAALALLLLLRL